MIEDDDLPPLREVKVKPYGSHGLIPADPKDCPYRDEGACISRSGTSLCGALFDEDHDAQPGQDTIRCMEEADFSPDIWNALHPGASAH